MAYEVKANVEQFKKESEERKKWSGSTNFYEIQDGENPLRLLPRSMKIFTPEGDYGFAQRYLVHYNMFEVQGFRMIVCPMTYKESCPICEMIDAEDDKQKIGRIRKQERFMYNVFDLRDEEMKVLETGPQIYDGFSKHWLDADWGPARMIGIKEGSVVKITKIPAEKSTTGWNHYDVVMTPRQVDLEGKLPKDWQELVEVLKDKVPMVRSREDLIKLVDCYKKGVAPNKEDMSKREAVTEERAADLVNKASKQAAPAQAPVTLQQPVQQAAPAQPVQPAGDKKIPECFGIEFSPRKDKCKTCYYWVKCREAFTQA